MWHVFRFRSFDSSALSQCRGVKHWTVLCMGPIELDTAQVFLIWNLGFFSSGEFVFYVPFKNFLFCFLFVEFLLFICQTFWTRHLIFFPFHLTVLLPLWWNFFLVLCPPTLTPRFSLRNYICSFPEHFLLKFFSFRSIQLVVSQVHCLPFWDESLQRCSFFLIFLQCLFSPSQIFFFFFACIPFTLEF